MGSPDILVALPPVDRQVLVEQLLLRQPQVPGDLWKLIHFVSNDPAAPEDRFEFYQLRGPQGPADTLELVDLGEGHPAFPATRQAYEELVGG